MHGTFRLGWYHICLRISAFAVDGSGTKPKLLQRSYCFQSASTYYKWTHSNAYETETALFITVLSKFTLKIIL